MDKAIAELLFKKHPKLQTFIAAGTISLKAARTILEIDRWLMYDIFTQMLQAGMVTSTGATSWRATADLITYLEERKNVDSV